MNSVFSEQILADKLCKLNSSQQCIETLSHWCIFHIDKAEQVVQTWDRQFHSSQKEQKIPFLYLANDIIQNSRRKGNEFAIEFWKVLPAALKDVAEQGDERGKSVVSRLVGIWEERRVFGSRGQDLKDLMLGNNPMPALELNKKRSRSVRIIKRDSRSIKIRLSIGANAEKIISALHTVLSERHNEDADLNRCQAAVHRVRKMEKDVDVACKKVGDPERVTLAKGLQEQESIIKECVEKLKSFEANRADLVSHLREALNEQESELESVRTQLQVAQAQMEEAANMCRRLNDEPPIPSTSLAQNPITSGTERTKKTAADIAAEVADRLAASTHSQQIMTSVLSTFAAEEAKNAGLMPTSKSANSAPANTSENGPKAGKPMLGSQTSFVSGQSVSNAAAHQPQTVFIHQPSIQNQASVAQPQYSMFPAPPQQFVQPSGAVLIGVPYTYTSLPPPPPPPPPVHVVNLARPPLTQQQQTMAIMQASPPPLPPPPPPMTLQQSMSINMQTIPVSLQPALPSYRPLQPPSMAYYQHRSQ
ncbi:hypothetical protein Taro_055269 [Colocasia esculenta]|uniref:CID domain-containing protein n=1 Tax=Colocasia esculenta TaxID=4460 RepID=A0A843XQZ8_COLES|nr:hypothetical protein [Colocasia esculenta]